MKEGMKKRKQNRKKKGWWNKKQGRKKTMREERVGQVGKEGEKKGRIHGESKRRKLRKEGKNEKAMTRKK